MERHQLCAAAGRHRRHGLVLRLAGTRTLAPEACRDAIPCSDCSPTPSQKATVKYFFVVAALWVVQVALGAIVAHYGVEGGGFYGIPLAKWLPYSVARTWHLADWHLLDRDLVAGDRALHRSGSQRGGTEGTTAWRECALCRACGRRRRFACRRMAGHPAEARQPVVLVRLTRLRIRRPRPRLADPAVRRPGVLAVADVARTEAGAGAHATRTIRC